MKKLLFLPLAAMLCFGCSKDALQSDTPDVAKQEASSKVAQEYVQVTFNNYVSGNLTNNSYIEYIDEYGEHQTLYPTMLSTYINVAKTGSLTVNIFVDAKVGGGYQTIYTTVTADTDPAFYRDFTGANPINVISWVDMVNVSTDRVTVTLMADLDDFRSGTH